MKAMKLSSKYLALIKEVIKQARARNLKRPQSSLNWEGLMVKDFKDAILKEMALEAEANRELEEFLQKCSCEELATIMAVMWIGREKQDGWRITTKTCELYFKDALERLKKRNKANEIKYILSKNPLPQYLEAGLRVLKELKILGSEAR